jgi:hypothetical protein
VGESAPQRKRRGFGAGGDGRNEIALPDKALDLPGAEAEENR